MWCMPKLLFPGLPLMIMMVIHDFNFFSAAGGRGVIVLVWNHILFNSCILVRICHVLDGSVQNCSISCEMIMETPQSICNIISAMAWQLAQECSYLPVCQDFTWFLNKLSINQNLLWPSDTIWAYGDIDLGQHGLVAPSHYLLLEPMLTSHQWGFVTLT